MRYEIIMSFMKYFVLQQSIKEYLGDVYVALGKYGEASNAYMSVVSMLENLYGDNYERI